MVSKEGGSCIVGADCPRVVKEDEYGKIDGENSGGNNGTVGSEQRNGVKGRMGSGWSELSVRSGCKVTGRG